MSAVGAVLAHAEAATHLRGYQKVLSFGRKQFPDARCWALKGTPKLRGRAGRLLDANGERVVEMCRPKRPPQRGGRKIDAIDAVRAAREALTAEHLIHPRRRGEREALRVLMATRQGAVTSCTAAINHLKALIVSAPEDLRDRPRRPDHRDGRIRASLGMSVIAEGVETAGEIAGLQAAGVTVAQGFFLGRPQPQPQLEGLVGPHAA